MYVVVPMCVNCTAYSAEMAIHGTWLMTEFGEAFRKTVPLLRFVRYAIIINLYIFGTQEIFPKIASYQLFVVCLRDLVNQSFFLFTGIHSAITS